MKQFLFKINRIIKGLIFVLRPHVFLGWLRHPFLTMSNTLSLTKWIASQNKNGIFNDFYTLKRDYSKRYKLYQYIIDTQKLNNEALDYLEFGVSKGFSFKWWIENNKNNDSKFYGFDTFEGLPESWGLFGKGDMAADLPVFDDNRGKFIKGLFQDTLPDFLKQHQFNNKKRIIHLDADLFSATLYVLTSLAPYLRKGDILIFDEFNVPNHEYFAFKLFSDSYYVKTKLLAAANNYYQVAMVIE